MRNIQEVIDEMLAAIPETETKLIKYLNTAKLNIAYQAPESIIPFERVQAILAEEMQIPSKEWHYQVCSIFSTIPVEKLNKMVQEYKERNTQSDEKTQ